ncbi:MAG: hypothetical protein OXH28_12560 [bacterium]|nr:hypothetical protein [bacterium]
MGVLTGDSYRRDQAGSGTAIGVAILFPALMLVIVSLSMLSGSARIEQALQSAANRAARAAALCCHYTGGSGGAEAVVQASLTAAQGNVAANRVRCINDLVSASVLIVTDVEGNYVPIAADRPVPAGGTLRVVLTCEVRPEAMGGVGFPGLDIRRTVVGTASIDPYRARSGG